MGIICIQFVLGPLENNTYLVVDSDTGEAVVIDPSFDSQVVIDEVRQQGWKLTQVWLTHAHFDHIAGVSTITQSTQPPLPVGLHPGDLVLWKQDGSAPQFGVAFESGPEPSIEFSHGQILKLGKSSFEVRHTPGHTRGHVVFVSLDEEIVWCGDLIFNGSVGRTDMPGGDTAALLHSIRTQILTLPASTRLLSGHGLETTVGAEAKHNPYL
ncbi:MAG TPA: MBL fold metallo-hydrolase [Anaerolineaceae bacterium]|nr:MBL fold metallo-hydrolase [Anaerolineaceae bacterium]